MNKPNPKGLILALFTVLFVVLSLSSTREGGYPSKLFEALSNNKEKTAPRDLRIVKWGPTTTKLGVGFNLQRNGRSALWMHLNTRLARKNAHIVFDGVKLVSAVSDKVITALVPANLYAVSGKATVYVEADYDGILIRSQPVQFAVTK